MKSNKKELTLSYSVCNYVIWRPVYAFCALSLIAQFEGNEFCLMVYATVRVFMRFFFISRVCSLCYTSLFTHALSNFTLHTLSVIGWK